VEYRTKDECNAKRLAQGAAEMDKREKDGKERRNEKGGKWV